MDSAANRATQYRNEAASLRELAALAAKTIPGSMLRNQFLGLADDYDRLARQAETNRHEAR